MTRWALSCLLLLAAACQAPPPQRLEPLVAEHDLAGVHYVEVVPVTADLSRPLPMVVLIHGLGDKPRASWIVRDAYPARYILPQAPEPYGDGYSWFPYRIGEQNPDLAQHIEAGIELLSGFLREAVRKHPTYGKPIVSGFSQGGILTYGLALQHPAQLSAAHPVAGVLPEELWPEEPLSKSQPPIRAAHGGADPIIPVEPTVDMVQALAERGFDVRLRRFAQVGHTRSPDMEQMADDFFFQAIAEVDR